MVWSQAQGGGGYLLIPSLDTLDRDKAATQGPYHGQSLRTVTQLRADSCYYHFRQGVHCELKTMIWSLFLSNGTSAGSIQGLPCQTLCIPHWAPCWSSCWSWWWSRQSHGGHHLPYLKVRVNGNKNFGLPIFTSVAPTSCLNRWFLHHLLLHLYKQVITCSHL